MAKIKALDVGKVAKQYLHAFLYIIFCYKWGAKPTDPK